MNGTTEKQELPTLSEEAQQRLESIFGFMENKQAVQEDAMKALEILLAHIDEKKQQRSAMLCFLLYDTCRPEAFIHCRKKKGEPLQQQTA